MFEATERIWFGNWYVEFGLLYTAITKRVVNIFYDPGIS